MSEPITQRLHEHLHTLPGMPAHSEADRMNQNQHAHHHHGGGHHLSLSNPNGQHAGPPRVLVAWQNWIGSLFAGWGARR